MTAPLDLAALRKLAEAATPGPWDAPGYGEVWAGAGYEGQLLLQSNGDTDTKLANARFIAAVNPAAILSLLAALEEAEELLREAMLFLDNPGLTAFQRHDERGQLTPRSDITEIAARIRAALTSTSTGAGEGKADE